MKNRMTFAALSGALALSLLHTGPVLAQDDSSVLEEIIVSARKRDESLQDVPIAVSAFGVQEIADRGIRDVSDVARFTPGLSFAKAFGRATDRPVIRGQGNVLAGVQFGVESGAAYFVDGVYYPGDLSSLDLANLERVEVIRGPQAALYGRNTYSGAINFVTRGIGDSLGTSVRTRFGEDGEQDIYVSVRGPISDKWAGSLTGRQYSYEGEYTNVVTNKVVGDEETLSVSGELQFTPSDNFTLSARATYQEDDDGTRPFFLQPSESNNCAPGTRSNASWLWTGSSNNNQYFCGQIHRPSDTVALNDGDAVGTFVVPGIPDVTLPGFDIPGAFPPGLFPGGDPYNPTAGVAFSGVERDIMLASLSADWSFDNDWSMTANVTIRDEDRKTGSDSDHSSVNFIGQSFNPSPAPRTVECTFCASGADETEDLSFEVRLQSPADRPTRFLVGAFYYDQERDERDITWTGIDPPDLRTTTDNVAVFGSIERDFSDRLTGSLELRWFDEEKGRTELDGAAPVTFKKSFDEIAPRVTLDYQVSDNVMLYGIYSKGYKPGGVIGSDGATLVPPTTDYEQEESDNFEIGVKSTLWNGRMVLNAAAFFIDAENIQLTTPLSSGGGGALTSVVTNQGSGETKGIEIEMRANLTENASIGINYALADTEFTQGCDDFQWTLTSGGGQLLDAEACTGSNPNGMGDGSIAGNQFPLSSQDQYSIFADLTFPLSNGTEFFSNISLSYEDKKPVQVHNLAWVPSAHVLDAQIGWRNDEWTVLVYGRNLTDEDAPSMVTRWLQDPLLSIYASGVFGSQVDPTNAGAPAGFCGPNPCVTNFPRAFFGDMRRGINMGIEVSYDFGR